MAQLRIPLDATRFSKGMTWKEYMGQMATPGPTQEKYNKATGPTKSASSFSV